MTRTCETCPTPLRPGAHRATRFCPECVTARELARQAAKTRSAKQCARRAALRAARREGDTTGVGRMELAPGGSPTFRQRADTALNRGRCRRHCPACGRTYQMQGLESACPGCADHLHDVPPQARFA